jgi:hypothetical protein
MASGLAMLAALRIGASCATAAVLLLVASTPAAGAPKPITGKLSEPGYTVIALAADGDATAVRARRSKKFRLRPPATRVTLHLRARNGVYAGAIVVRRAKRGRRAIVGVRAGVRLGKVRVNVRRGYAKARRVRPKWVDAKRWARARNGVPIGNGRNSGFVRSKPPRHPPPGDLDADGVADPLDVDANGNKVLDNLDRSTRARAAQAESGFGIHSDLSLPIYDTANANAPGSTDERIEATLPRLGILNVNIVAGDSAELDCGRPQIRTDPSVGGLVYCSAGGTGRVPVNRNPPEGPAFPGDPGGTYDPDGDGFGSLATEPNLAPGARSLTLLHGATTAQIGTGDVLVQRVTSGGVESDFPSSVQFVFATASALVSYADTAGNSATVPYPIAGYEPGPPGPGTNDDPFEVEPGPDGDVVLTLTFWRPQRRPIPPDPETGLGGDACLQDDPPCKWIDIGGLTYTTGLSGVGFVCPQSSLSENDPEELEPATSPVLHTGGGVSDLAPDRAADAANTFTYTVNVTQCLESTGRSWAQGETLGLDFIGVSGLDRVGQGVAFKRK